MIRRALMLAAAVFVFLLPAAARGFELHLLSGMIVRGELAGFDKGVFCVKTDFGTVYVETAKLDFILVEEEDAQAYPAPSGPGMGVIAPEDAAPRQAASQSGEAAPAPAEAARAETIEIIRGFERAEAEVPVPLGSFSAAPDAWLRDNADAGSFFPGLFKGEGE